MISTTKITSTVYPIDMLADRIPSGSNDWKTLLACSDGDSGPTRDISCGDTDGDGWGDIEKRQRRLENMHEETGQETVIRD